MLHVLSANGTLHIKPSQRVWVSLALTIPCVNDNVTRALNTSHASTLSILQLSHAIQITMSGSGQAETSSGQSASAFAASFVTAVVVFAIEIIAFLVIKDRLSRIYLPRTYLVPERERTKAPAP